MNNFMRAVRSAGRKARAASRVRGVTSLLSGTPLRLKSAYGPELAIRRGDATFESCVSEGYGTFTSGIIARQDKPFLFLDIGANIGIYSLLASQNPHCTAVLAFEPMTDSFAHLANNIKINKMDNIYPFCVALTDADGPNLLEMSFDAAHSGTSRILSAPSSSSKLAISLGTAFLDNLLARWPDRRVVAKIDVEGAEESVLKAMFLASDRDRIAELIVEVSSLNRDGHEAVGIINILETNGFKEIGRRGRPEHYDAHYVRDPGSARTA